MRMRANAHVACERITVAQEPKRISLLGEKTGKVTESCAKPRDRQLLGGHFRRVALSTNINIHHIL